MHSAESSRICQKRERPTWLVIKIVPGWFWSFSVAPISKGKSEKQFYKYITQNYEKEDI